MIITKTAATCGKYLMSSVAKRCPSVAQILKNPCRTINMGLDAPRLGNIGGKMGSYDLPTLEAFIGTWNEIEKENYEEFLRATGTAEKTARYMASRKSWVVYSIDRDEITCVYGLENSDYTGMFTTTLGKPFHYDYFNGLPIKATYYQDGYALKEQHVCEDKPDFVIHVTREITDHNRMVAHSQYKNVVATKVLKKSLQPTEYFHL